MVMVAVIHVSVVFLKQRKTGENIRVVSWKSYIPCLLN